jgi:uncharacterized repeat protein (TIGR03847 family)
LPETNTIDLGLVDSLAPEAVGRPGERTFKITARSAAGKAVVWLEKEQLFQVGISIQQFTSTRKPPRRPERYEPPAPLEGRPVDIEFQARGMSLRHDASTDVFTIAAANFAEDDETAPDGERAPENDNPIEVLINFTRASADALARQALEVVAAGRKPCPLCSAPMDPGGHFCVRKNGHPKAPAG